MGNFIQQTLKEIQVPLIFGMAAIESLELGFQQVRGLSVHLQNHCHLQLFVFLESLNI